MSTYTYCHSEALLHSAIKRLSTSPEILFDCEGKTLGCKGGKLALVSLGTSFHRSRNEIYLVDILCYERDTLKPLFDILKDPKRPKIVFDGRNDFSELYHGFGVELKGVLDLQLADIVSRDGESEDTQLRRLSPGIRRGDIEAARASYTMVHRLSGLKGCAIEHKVAVETEKKRISHDHWLERPINTELLEYAANDIELIGKLHRYFKMRGYLRTDLKEQSERYVTLHQAQRPHKNDMFIQNGFLPLDILELGTPSRTCGACKRRLSPNCFLANGKPGETRDCHVCRAIRTKWRPPTNPQRKDEGSSNNRGRGGRGRPVPAQARTQMNDHSNTRNGGATSSLNDGSSNNRGRGRRGRPVPAQARTQMNYHSNTRDGGATSSSDGGSYGGSAILSAREALGCTFEEYALEFTCGQYQDWDSD